MELNVKVPGEERPVVLIGNGGEHADWQVFVGGEAVGEVRRFERRFNLRRVIVIRGWRAYLRDAAARELPRRLPEGGRDSCFDTRQQAVEALLKVVPG
jgi:hypothetical protein